MPLMTCPDCQREISDRAPACPHCGAPNVRTSTQAMVSAPMSPNSNGEERTVWSGKPSQKSAALFYIVFFPFFWMILPLLMIIYRYLVIRCTSYAFTTQRLTIKMGILNRSTEEVELYRVNDITLGEPLLLRVFGLGNVLVITTDSTAPAFILWGISSPDKVRQQLREQVKNARAGRRTMLVESV
jgi:membrane protein YdbS with pleckstrin-like domain